VGWIVVVVVGAVVAVVGWVLWSRSRTASAPSPESTPQRPSRVSEAAPMTGLQVALDEATDRSGRNMRDKIESGTAIDDLIVPEDTGPILRRALDNVGHAEPPLMPEPVAGTAATEPPARETPPLEG
jgi:hypothetical protein